MKLAGLALENLHVVGARRRDGWPRVMCARHATPGALVPGKDVPPFPHKAELLDLFLCPCPFFFFSFYPLSASLFCSRFLLGRNCILLVASEDFPASAVFPASAGHLPSVSLASLDSGNKSGSPILAFRSGQARNAFYI